MQQCQMSLPGSFHANCFQALLERDEQMRKVGDESVQEQRKLKQQLEEETASAVELRDSVEQLSLRKEELKQQLFDKEAELDEFKETYRYGITLV